MCYDSWSLIIGWIPVSARYLGSFSQYFDQVQRLSLVSRDTSKLHSVNLPFYFQTHEKLEQATATVLQERELRSVAEQCLVESRTAWQNVHHLAADTRQRCVEMHQLLSTMRSVLESRKRYGSFLKRFSNDHSFSETSIFLTIDNSVSNFGWHYQRHSGRWLPVDL